MYLEKIDAPDKERGRRQRRWTYLPPQAGSAGELEGVELLEELPDLLGLLLFQRYRDVLLWHQTPNAERNHLFDPGGTAVLLGGRTLETPEALAEPLDVLAGMLRPPGPGSAAGVVSACSGVASWAYETGLPVAAAAFARLAAVVDPEDPALAFAAGRATRDTGRLALAEAWFQRTVSISRRVKNDGAKAAAYIGWGVLEDRRGRRRAARARFEMALRTATGAGVGAMAGLAHQYLMALTVPDGTFEEGFAHALAAGRYFAEDDPRLIRLAIDIGAFLSEHRYFSTALRLYEAAFPFLTRPADRLAGLANIGRAAAATGAKQRFAEVWAAFDRLSLSPPKQLYVESLIELAQGAITLRYWRHASKMVREAARAARAQDNQRAVVTARTIEQAIEAREGGDQDRPPDPALQRLADRLVGRIAAMVQPR